MHARGRLGFEIGYIYLDRHQSGWVRIYGSSDVAIKVLEFFAIPRPESEPQKLGVYLERERIFLPSYPLH